MYRHSKSFCEHLTLGCESELGGKHSNGFLVLNPCPLVLQLCLLRFPLAGGLFPSCMYTLTKSSSSWGNSSVDTSSHQWGGPGDWPREGLRCAPTSAAKYNWELMWLWTDKGWGLALCYSLSRLTQDWKASCIRSSDLRGTHTVHLGMMRSQRSWKVHGNRRLCLPLSSEPLVVFFRFNHCHQTVNKQNSTR